VERRKHVLAIRDDELDVRLSHDMLSEVAGRRAHVGVPRKFTPG
jgi:hypothetical protein